MNATTTKLPIRLTRAQREALQLLKAAGPAGILRPGGWTAAQSLVRHGFATAEVVEAGVLASDFYARQGTHTPCRSWTHTVSGTPRRLSIVRFVAVDPTPPEARAQALRAMRAEALHSGDTATAAAAHAELAKMAGRPSR